MERGMMIFGRTGAGKSTLTNILAGRTLESERRTIKQLEGQESEPLISSSRMQSCTRRPVFV